MNISILTSVWTVFLFSGKYTNVLSINIKLLYLHLYLHIQQK